MLNKTSKLIQGLECAIFAIMVPYGEHIQNEVLLGNEKYTWATGHLSDIGYAGALTIAGLLSSKGDNRARNALLIPTAMSFLEVLAAYHPKINFDWQDIACYYGAALFAYSTNKICNLLSEETVPNQISN